MNMADDNSDSNKIDAYGEYFDLWTKTRDERADYNTYFITLLFTNILFGILVAILGAAVVPYYPLLSWNLLLAALLSAIGISFVCPIRCRNHQSGNLPVAIKATQNASLPFMSII